MTLGANLKRARNTAKMTQAALAEKAGVPQSLISDLEGGRRKSTGSLPELAEALGVPISELDLRYDAPIVRPPVPMMDDVDKMPVYAAAEGGDGHMVISTDTIDWVPRPYTLQGIPEAYAILVQGESMVPAYEPGDYAWVNPRLPPQRNTDCILYDIPGDGQEPLVTIKRLVTWTADHWTLRQYNPAKDFKADRSVWNKHHRVVGNFRRR